MNKIEGKQLQKQLKLETAYREWILDPEAQNVVKDLFDDKFPYFTKDFIREFKDRIDWWNESVRWYVFTDNEIFEEYKHLYY